MATAMKPRRPIARSKAFNLIELLAVIAIIALVTATFLQKKPRRPQQVTSRNNQYRCINNQKHIVDAFLMLSKDNGGKLPWELSAGTNNPTDPAPMYATLAPYLRDLNELVCPTDRARAAASSFKSLTRSNLSYFVNLDSTLSVTNKGDMIIGGDRHLQWGTNVVGPGVFVYQSGMAMNWSSDLHSSSSYAPIGLLMFADGHVERVSTNIGSMNAAFEDQKLAQARFLVP